MRIDQKYFVKSRLISIDLFSKIFHCLKIFFLFFIRFVVINVSNFLHSENIMNTLIIPILCKVAPPLWLCSCIHLSPSGSSSGLAAHNRFQAHCQHSHFRSIVLRYDEYQLFHFTENIPQVFLLFLISNRVDWI